MSNFKANIIDKTHRTGTRLVNYIKHYKPVAVMIAFGLIGSLFLFASHAATPSTSIEIENSSSLSSNCATIQDDSSASGGKAVKFGCAAQQPTLNAGAQLPIQYDIGTLSGTVCCYQWFRL